MRWNAFSTQQCKWCGEPREQPDTGRPGEYCDTKCRQAAYRARKKNSCDTEPYDQWLRENLDAAEDDIRRLRECLAESAQCEEPLRRLVALRRHVDQMCAVAVGRTRHRGASWQAVAELLAMNKDHARKKYGPEVVGRALSRRPLRPPAAPAPGSDAGPPGRRPSTPLPQQIQPGTAPEADDVHDAAAADHPTGAGDLASVLSSLQRASDHTLRTLGEETGLSASFLSRIMNGERFPTWRTTALIARACGADPQVLRRVWEDAGARRDRKDDPHALLSALRYLHQRAGNPSPWAIAVSSSHTLNQEAITAALEGSLLLPWDDTQRLIHVLDGEPAFFEPLWQAASACQPVTAQPARSAPPTIPSTTPTHGRVSELCAAYNSTFKTTTTRLFHTRRILPAPIPALAHPSL
ncbi:helix-turn-helix transcriptional regulator [Streptomyces sp. NPDC050315]|uniref:helix-turn-helix domain-containing protein n=1 Tax=Streptomyces sp. NPDC050315 TaxID=3155039 RepID=UPI003443F596